jgi:type II secretory pathway component PulC
MKKNFNFNLKFLERFKKKPTTSVDDKTSPGISLPEDFIESLPNIPEIPEAPPAAPIIKKKFNFNFLEKLKSKPIEENDQNDYSPEDISPASNPLPDQPEIANKVKILFPKFSKPKFNSPIDQLHKFNWNDFVLKIFSPYSRGKIHSWFFILIIVSTTYIIGKSIALYFSKSNTVITRIPALPIQQVSPDMATAEIGKIASANLFNAKENEKATSGQAVKIDIASIVCREADRPSNIPAKLIDTVILQDSVKSVASVQVRGGSELLNLREGEKIDETVEISKITRQKLIVKNLQTGDCEYLMADSEEVSAAPPLKILSQKEGRALFKSQNPNIKNVGNNFKIKKTFRESMMNNISEILSQAKAIQITNPDGSLCFKMTEVVPGSLYTQLNIQENDIVCSMNGKKIENLNELMGFLGKVREIDNMQIGLQRNGMTENLEYSFE